MKKTTIINQLEDISSSIDYLSLNETESLLYSLSFSQSFIELCSEYSSLDDLLIECFSSTKDIIKCNIQHMIEILG